MPVYVPGIVRKVMFMVGPAGPTRWLDRRATPIPLPVISVLISAFTVGCFAWPQGRRAVISDRAEMLEQDSDTFCWKHTRAPKWCLDPWKMSFLFEIITNWERERTRGAAELLKTSDKQLVQQTDCQWCFGLNTDPIYSGILPFSASALQSVWLWPWVLLRKSKDHQRENGDFLPRKNSTTFLLLLFLLRPCKPQQTARLFLIPLFAHGCNLWACRAVVEPRLLLRLNLLDVWSLRGFFWELIANIWLSDKYTAPGIDVFAGFKRVNRCSWPLHSAGATRIPLRTRFSQSCTQNLLKVGRRVFKQCKHTPPNDETLNAVIHSDDSLRGLILGKTENRDLVQPPDVA